MPILEVRGHYSESWLGKIGENRQYAGGWVMLGTVDIVASPHTTMPRDRFRIAGQEGPFKKLKFVARRGAVDLNSVSINAGDGREETVPINTILLPGVQTAPFVLSNGAMPIGTIALSPRLHSSSRVDASVEVWAQY